MDNAENRQETTPNEPPVNQPGAVIMPDNVSPPNNVPVTPNVSITPPVQEQIQPQQPTYVAPQQIEPAQQIVTGAEQPSVPIPPAPNYDPGINQNTTYNDPQPFTSFLKNPDDQALPDNANQAVSVPAANMGWVAPEFVEHEKTSDWYLILIFIAVVPSALVYLLTKDIVTVLVIILAVITLGAYGRRRPRNIQYNLDEKSVTIGRKAFSYGDFRAFSTVSEGSFTTLTLAPLKRFSPPVGLCVPKNDESAIVDFLSNRLPLEKHKTDYLDRMMNYIHF
jgi:hypothetical protein